MIIIIVRYLWHRNFFINLTPHCADKSAYTGLEYSISESKAVLVRAMPSVRVFFKEKYLMPTA